MYQTGSHGDPSGRDARAGKATHEQDEPLHSSLASQLQGNAELWQELARRQQEVVSQIQEAALRQGELVKLWGGVENQAMEDLSRRLEEKLLELARFALGLEGRVLEQVEVVIEQVEAVLQKHSDDA